MRIDSIIIEETEKAYDSEYIYRYGTCVFALTDKTFCVYKQIHKKFEFFSKKHLHSCVLWYILKKLVTLIAMKREVAARVAQVFRGANVKFENWRQVTVQS